MHYYKIIYYYTTCCNYCICYSFIEYYMQRQYNRYSLNISSVRRFIYMDSK